METTPAKTGMRSKRISTHKSPEASPPNAKVILYTAADTSLEPGLYAGDPTRSR